MQYLNKGDIIHCLVSSFSSKSRYCIIVDYTIVKNEIYTITVLPITTKIKKEDLCVCLDCDETCTKIQLTRNDTTKSFTFTSYLFLTSYTIPFTECDCTTNIYKNS